MTEVRQTFEKLNDDELLRKRALGHDALSAEAHEAIEQILRERGIDPPPIPIKTIEGLDRGDRKQGKLSAQMKLISATVVVLAFFGSAIGFKSTQINTIILLVVLAICLWFWMIRATATNTERLKLKSEDDPAFTELMQTAVLGDVARAQELLNYGASINAQDRKGTTALMYAVSNNNLAMVKLLLEKNADISLKTMSDKTAMFFAKKYSSDEIKLLLEKHGT